LLGIHPLCVGMKHGAPSTSVRTCHFDKPKTGFASFRVFRVFRGVEFRFLG
jgi:hypothetical protein